MAATNLIYNVRQLNKTYDTDKVKIKALDEVSFTVSDGDMLAIMGRSGSGKSTLLRQMGLLDTPTSGSLVFEGKEMKTLQESDRAKLRLNSMGYVFQEYALLGELTAHQNVFLPGMMLGNGSDYKAKARELLELVGLGQRTGHYPRELSGGEQQRVAIARALINSPRVVLADEPCANLDTISSKSVMETLVQLNDHLKVTIVFISHDPTDKRYARKLIILSDGKITEEEKL